MNNHYDCLVHNATLASFAHQDAAYGEIIGKTVAIKDGRIEILSDNDPRVASQNATQNIDAAGQWMTPGLIDCHTHLVFGGNRANEFEWRLQGETYEAISKRGGGIVSTVTATRQLSEAQLFDQSAPRLERLLDEGVTSVEIKSGYGLSLEHEIKMLKVARALGEAYPVTVSTTFLGAHAVPPEFASLTDAKQRYIDHVCSDMLPAVADLGLADAVDVFCEGIGFSAKQCEQVFLAAKSLNLPIKGHVEQLSDLGGAVLAARHKALSVDHVEYVQADDVAALINTVAVLLPAAFYFLHETQQPPIAAFRQHNIAMAVATDLNPGTAPLASLLTAVNQACVLFGLTPEEALMGATKHAAKALNLSNKGIIRTGMDADLALWNIQHPAELAYGINFHRPTAIWQNGKLIRLATT